MSTLKVDGIRSNSATSDAITLASNGTCTANITNNLSNRNMVINGGMVCSQRGSSFANITNAYCLDRYKFRNNNGVTGTFTVSQSTDTPDGFGNSLKVDVGTADAAIASGEQFYLGTKLEGQDLQRLAKGTSGAKKSVLSFYVKTNKTGLYSVLLYDNDNNRMFSTSYTVSNTNWNRYTIDVPADTTGAYANDNGASLEIYWYLGLGSDKQSGSFQTTWTAYTAANTGPGQVNFADSTSNEFYITGIQYEVNESGVATDFEHRSYTQELALAQRYYQVLAQPAADKIICFGGYMATEWIGVVHFPQEMRIAPTLVVSNFTNAFRIYGNGASFNPPTLVTDTAMNTTRSFYLRAIDSTNVERAYLRVLSANSGVYATLAVSAEL